MDVDWHGHVEALMEVKVQLTQTPMTDELDIKGLKEDQNLIYFHHFLLPFIPLTVVSWCTGYTESNNLGL